MDHSVDKRFLCIKGAKMLKQMCKGMRSNVFTLKITFYVYYYWQYLWVYYVVRCTYKVRSMQTL